MSNDGMMLLTISGVTPEEFFKRFGEVAQRFGYVLGPIAEVVREAEFNLPEPITIGEAPTAAALEVKKRRVRRTRAQIEADNARGRPVPSTVQIEADRTASETVEAEHGSPLTIADVKLAGGRLLQANNGDPAKLRALLDHYGVVRMTPLPEEHWAEFISLCDQGGLDDLAL